MKEGKVGGQLRPDQGGQFTADSPENKNLPFLGYKPFTNDDGYTGICGSVKFYNGNCRGAYETMIKDANLLIGAFKGYYKEQTLEERGEKLDWILDRFF